MQRSARAASGCPSSLVVALAPLAIWSIAGALPLALAPPSAALAESVFGTPSITDGDTLRIDEERVRLRDIDSPEKTQPCRMPGGAVPGSPPIEYECGVRATDHLKELVGGSAVRCDFAQRDHWGRALGTCFPEDYPNSDYNRAMVRDGWALVYRKYSDRYIPDEEYARQHKLGMHAGTFQPPWEWRDANR